MCMEDYVIGRNIYAVITNHAAGATATVGANRNRVGFRVCLEGGADFARIFAGSSITDPFVQLVISPFFYVELLLRTHGQIVQDQFFIDGAGCASPWSSTELILRSEVEPPAWTTRLTEHIEAISKKLWPS